MARTILSKGSFEALHTARTSVASPTALGCWWAQAGCWTWEIMEFVLSKLNSGTISFPDLSGLLKSASASQTWN